MNNAYIMNFIHLNTHSSFSKGWGIGSVANLCQSANAFGMESFALTDTNNLYGLIFFLEAAREAGIQPIVGSEILTDNNRAVLLVKDREGYANLCRIISDRKCHNDFDFIVSLKKYRQGLIILSDDFRLLKSLKHDSNRDIYVEMSPGYDMHKCLAFSRASQIPPVATNRVFFTEKKQFQIHRVLRSIDLNSKLSRLKRDDCCRDHNFFNSAPSMIDQYPHAPEAISNTIEVSNQCMKEWDIFSLTFPDFENMNNKQAFDSLYEATIEGCKKRYGDVTPQVKKRIDHEMKIIKEKHFSHYFLVVADLAAKVPRSCGRGSAAASIVSYALGITHVDPIKHNLFFERFLNPGRVDPPDIDIDFAWDEREQVLDYLFSRHGNKRAAMVANHNTFGARSAVREVAKVFGLTEQEIGRITDKIGFGWQLKKGWKELKDHPKMRDIDFTEPWDEVLDTAVQLEGKLNHLSVHCGGVVIVPDEIRRYCPVEVSANGAQVLQWEKDSVEKAGLVKIDILGNRSLAVIRDSIDLVKRNHGIKIDYADWNPIDDPETVKIFYSGDTFGVFYFESPATRQVLIKVASGITFGDYIKMDHFHLNVVVTSIIRPASNQCIKTWVSRLHGQPWDPPHHLLTPVLNETLGVMVFQEQLSQAAIYMGGFDAAEADMLRKVVSKKNSEKKLRDFYERFVLGASEKGVKREIIDNVWEMMMGFDGYSFCKPHSASYTMVAYKSAWLRAHYPAEFMASVISNMGGFYSTFGYISEARRMGLKVLPPDINSSEIKYTGKAKSIRTGLMQLKDFSMEAKESIIYERGKNGSFKSVKDFLKRMSGNIHLQDARVLIKSGCLDSINDGVNRPGLIWKALEFFNRKEEAKAPTLFDYNKKRNSGVIPVLKRESYPKHTMLKHESEILGFTLSVHPLELYEDLLKKLHYVRAMDLAKNVGKYVTMIGWLVTGKTVRTKEGDQMKFISFEDTTGIYETVFFPRVYNRYCHMLNAARPYILKGKVDMDFGSTNVNVQWVGFLDRYKR